MYLPTHHLSPARPFTTAFRPARTVLCNTNSSSCRCIPGSTEHLCATCASRWIVDPDTAPASRMRAAEVLDLAPSAPIRVLVDCSGRTEVIPADRAVCVEDRRSRTGVGPPVPLADAALSARRARIAAALAADGTDDDPGPLVLWADDLGILLDLASSVDAKRLRDVEAVEESAAARGCWVLATLDALVNHCSVRHAATELFVHHSTLQGRISNLEDDLGWSLHDAQGRHRLYLAMSIRRFLRHPPKP